MPIHPLYKHYDHQNQDINQILFNTVINLQTLFVFHQLFCKAEQINPCPHFKNVMS